MKFKYYQVDYAEMKGQEIESMGIVNLQLAKDVSKDVFSDYVRQLIKKPNAAIVISNISKLSKDDFEQLTSQKASQ